MGVTQSTWGSSRFHGWLPLLISSHEVDGVRKEKERLTTDHQGLVVAFLSFFFATLRLGCQGERASLKVKTTSTTGRRKGAQGLTVWPLHRLVKPVTSLSSRMKSLGYETTWRCHQNPFIGALGIQEPVIPGEPLIKGLPMAAGDRFLISEEIQRKVHGILNASSKICSLVVNGQSFLVTDGYLLNLF